MKTEFIKIIPYKMNTEAMKQRCRNLENPLSKINFLMSLQALKDAGVIYLTDFIEITKQCTIPPVWWEAYIGHIKTADQLIMYGKLVTFAGQCGVLKVSDDLIISINQHLEFIYKNYK